MTSAINEIWAGDQLNRRDEADMLERFLIGEVDILKKQGRCQSYVLALDAQYGEGKSWFLDRLARQLRLNHPVAFVDAWVDDANEEPFVAIMSAIEDGLSPYLSKNKKMAGKFKAASRAALPIIGKMAVGAITKFSQKYLGEAIGSEIAGEFSKAKDAERGKEEKHNAIEEAISEGIGEAGKSLNTLVDKRAEAMLISYRERKQSREVFKHNMAELTDLISAADDQVSQPLFVIVDELDRCRPSYAIKLLEEIKHFFDVPGVVFIIALHGAQLTKSISAVYGVEFDSQSYLQRFFSRRYELRRLPVRELVIYLMGWWQYEDTRLERPPVQGDDNKPIEITAAEYAGRLLEEANVTPRECFAVIDALRIFYQQWDHKAPIELTWALALIVTQLRNKANNEKSLAPFKGKLRLMMPQSRRGYNQELTWSDAHSFTTKYWQVQDISLPDISSELNGEGVTAYMRYRLEREFAYEHANGYQIEKPYSLWRSYWAKLTEIGRFTNTVASAEP